ncbi:MFS general substrate transporter [Acephala macrosclerotiorum]|nr:MFS general substrate transporter [Acephala macrosclerotiorum]
MSESSKDVAASVHSLSEASLAVKSTAEKKLVRKLDLVSMPPLNWGLEADLGLVGNQFSLLLILFYIPYGLFNIPATMSAKKFNPAVVMPPVVMPLVVGMKELALRISAFGMMGFVAGAVSGIMAYSVFQWHKELKSRLDQDTSHEKGFIWADAVKEFKDWKMWTFGFMALMYGIGSNSSSNFLPTMAKRLTVDTAKANLYTVSPNLTAAFIQLTTSWLSDYFQQRATFSAGALVSLIKFILLGTLDLVHHVKVEYFITYLITFGTFTPGILVPAWVASTPTRRQNLAGIISSAVFRAQDALIYKLALITVAVTQGVFIAFCLLQRQYYARINKKLDNGEIGQVTGMELNPGFRYAL